MTSTTLSSKDQAAVESYFVKLMDGTVYRNHVASARSRYGYQPPISRTQWADAMRAVADMAAQSDALAQVARGIRINLYGDAGQAEASVWQAIVDATEDVMYDDVIGRSGPEGMSPSQAKRPWTLAERLQVLAWGTRIAAPFASSVPSIGWCAQRLADDNRVQLPR